MLLKAFLLLENRFRWWSWHLWLAKISWHHTRMKLFFPYPLCFWGIGPWKRRQRTWSLWSSGLQYFNWADYQRTDTAALLSAAHLLLFFLGARGARPAAGWLSSLWNECFTVLNWCKAQLGCNGTLAPISIFLRLPTCNLWQRRSCYISNQIVPEAEAER